MRNETTTLLEERVFLSSAANETYLLFDQGYPLRDFCAFEVFENEAALAELEDRYFVRLLDAAQEAGLGMLLDALIWRAHADFVAEFGYPVRDLARINSRAVLRTREAVAAWRKRTAECEVPVIVSPTVETDGRLPDGTKLGDFIRRVDDETDGSALYFIVNCAHPSHLEPTLAAARAEGADWQALQGVSRERVETEPRGARRGDRTRSRLPA